MTDSFASNRGNRKTPRRGSATSVVTRRAMRSAERPSPARFIDMHLAAIVMPAKAGIE
jgi:hypothetical protein